MAETDLISRQAVIDAMVKYVADGYAESPNDFEGYMEIAKELPSAQPERKRGKWIEYDTFSIISGRCSVCGWEAHLYEDDVVGMNYCPNCGAKMDGFEEE